VSLTALTVPFLSVFFLSAFLSAFVSAFVLVGVLLVVVDPRFVVPEEPLGSNELLVLFMMLIVELFTRTTGSLLVV
jgi:hypothetical protein